MTQNKLKLNDDRTDALVVGSCVCTCLIDSQSTEIEGVKENNRSAFRKKVFFIFTRDGLYSYSPPKTAELI